MDEFSGKANQPTFLEGGPLTEKWPECPVKPEPAMGLCAPSLHLQPEKKMTLTESWIAGLKAKRDAAIASGQYFDGEERDNVVSFQKHKADEHDDPWDYMPSDYNG